MIESLPHLSLGTPPMHHDMEPGQGKQGLGSDHRVSLFHVLLGPGFVGSLEVVFDSRRSLICDLEAGLQEDGGKG